MKTITLLFFITFSLTCFSQDAFKYIGNGKVLQFDKKISPSSLRSQFASESEMMHLYNAGRTKKIVGNILIYGGIATIIGNQFYLANNTKIDANGNLPQLNNPYLSTIIGGAMIIASIPIKIGFSKKIRKAVDLMNNEIKKQEVSSTEITSFLLNKNGIGFVVSF